MSHSRYLTIPIWICTYGSPSDKIPFDWLLWHRCYLSPEQFIINREVSYELSITIPIHNVFDNHDIADSFQCGFSGMHQNRLARSELGRQKYGRVFNKRLINIHNILPGHCYLKWQVLLHIWFFSVSI